MKNKNTILTVILSALILMVSVIVVNAENNLPIKKVLILHSDEEFIPANIDLNAALISKLKSSDKFTITIYSEYMDSHRLYNEALENQYAETFLKQYSELKPDVIIAIDYKAYTFLLTKAKEFYDSTPIVFCMIPKYLIDESSLPSNITGNYMSIDAKGTIETIMHMHPETEEVIIVSGAGPASKSKLDEISDNLKGVSYDIKVSYLQDKTIEDTLEILSNLPSKSIVLYNAIFEDAKGELFIPREALALMNNATSVPIYGLYFTNLDYGLVGGSLFEFKEVANDAADKVLKILDGANPSSLEILEVKNKVYFNWALFDKWNINEKNLLENSILLNKEFTIWELYKVQIVGLFIFIVLETFLLLFLLLQLRLRKKAELKLNNLNFVLEKLVDERTESLHMTNNDLGLKNKQLEEEIQVRISTEEELKIVVETLSDTQTQLIIAEKQTAINHLIRNLLHRINTPLGNNILYLDALDKNINESNELDEIVSKLKQINKQLVTTMEMLNSMLHIDNTEKYTEIDLGNYFPVILYDILLGSISDIVAVCYPNKHIIIQEKNFRKVIVSLYDFAKSQRIINNDLLRAEMIFDLSKDKLIIIYKDKALDLISNIKEVFDPYTFYSYKSTSSGLELVVLYNCVTVGLNGTIELLENQDKIFDRIIKISLPISIEI